MGDTTRDIRWVAASIVLLVLSACGVERHPSPPELVRFSSCDAVRAAMDEPSPPERPAQYPIEHTPPPERSGRFNGSGGIPDTVQLGPMGRDPAEPSRRKSTRDVVIEVRGVSGDADHGDLVVRQGAELRIARRTGARRGETDVAPLPGSPSLGERFEVEDPRVSVGVGGVLIDGETALVFTGGQGRLRTGAAHVVLNVRACVRHRR